MLVSRLQCTARMVFTPMTGPHWGDELMIPWVVAVSQYKCEILNVLTRRMGLTIEQAKQKWILAQVQIVEEVKQAIETLIKESPYGAFPCLLGRNPSIRPGAIQFFKAKVKYDIDDETASISPLVLTAPNADFDGDAMYFLSLKLKRDADACMLMHPKYTMLNNDGMKLAECVALPDQHLCILNAWLHDR